MKQYLIALDTEIIGDTFLIVTHTINSGKTRHFWEKDRAEFAKLYRNPNISFITFNGLSFDAPLVQAFVDGAAGPLLKRMASTIIDESLLPWQTAKRFDIQAIEADFIDLKEPAPGVMLSLKTYEGRMHYPHLQDMPLDHTTDISDSPEMQQMVLDYCVNDVMATVALFKEIEPEIRLRDKMGQRYGLDLRSKSGAQCAEAILRKVCGIEKKDAALPAVVRYTAPDFIKTSCDQINHLIQSIEAHAFEINQGNGSPHFPDFLKTPITINKGVYQFGIGGLHSKHDVRLHMQASDDLLISDFDVASYYPSLMLKAGIVPELEGGKGQVFIDTYGEIFNERIKAKKAADKDTANSLKLILNSTFGKLGNQFCSFYSPDLMLAVTITGQLNLLILIEELERIEGVTTLSANTDGIMLAYPRSAAAAVQAVFDANSAATGFEYEQTPYREIAMRDVNSYLAVTTDGKVKRKGAFATAGVMQATNPTFQICAEAAARYLQDRTPIDKTITECRDIREFVTVRNVTGGGVQHLYTKNVDDWVLEEDVGTKDNVWHSPSTGKKVRRKSRPAALQQLAGGVPFGRVARWYRSTRNYMPLTYVGSGNRVPDSDRAHLCLELPQTFPNDVDFAWYIDRAKEMLEGAGIKLTF